MQELDPRIVRLGIEIGGILKTYEGMSITASGTKYDNENQNEMEVKIANLDRSTRDYILTETSPFNQNKVKKRIFLEAGRVSYGASQIFVGDIISSTISQPPDITLSIKALTGNYSKGSVIARSQPAMMSLLKISEQVARDLGVPLDFQAKDRQIGNYSFTGGALKQVDKLQQAGNVNAYLDDDALIVKDYNAPLRGNIRRLNLDSGMIGIPEMTEQGLKVKFLLDNTTKIGSALEITSQLYPAANGVYNIYKLSFEIASRDVPFYYIAECKRI